MGEPRRFAGKVDGWFYAAIAGTNLLFAGMVVTTLAKSEPVGAAIGLICLAICDLVLVPMAARTFVEFDGGGNLTIVFGLQRASFPVAKVNRARETRSVLASLAASADRIELTAGYDQVMIAVKDKEGFLGELARRNPGTQIERRAARR
ncbi:PH domain-containing protein [Arabiibacter massiliensis]|uniref:PH domain-containing protein n=1 Tax=Arabiibacter massiliensis TaxID=1870985 RepID=UPI0009BB937F|nr:PH domain-containing protein [Arabiibacter massiliensis]